MQVLVYAALLGCLSPALSVVSLLSGCSPLLLPLTRNPTETPVDLQGAWLKPD
jgi:hypothetical protein